MPIFESKRVPGDSRSWLAAQLHVIPEKRAVPRIETPYPVRFRGGDSDGRRFREETVVANLSAGGLYLSLERRIDEGAEVSLALRLSLAPAGGAPALRMAVRGTVMRVELQRDGRYGVAVKFGRRRVL